MSLKVAPVTPPYLIAVRSLCEFTAKVGDLDLRFTPSPTAQEGIAGHLLVASRRGPDYQSEIALTADWHDLRVRGRADGCDMAQRRLEEVKTFRGDLAAMPDNHRQLHWAQLRMYGAMICAQRCWDDVTLALVYFDIGTQQETVLTEVRSADALQQHFALHCSRFLEWAKQQMAHRTARDAGCDALAFPHTAFRTGQRELARAVYHGAVNGRTLMAQAPTGIGKTVGTLFPLLKAMPSQKIDKIFVLVAKTPGRKLALDATELLRAAAPSIPLRTLELVARDKACEHPELACHGDSCPLARGFYDRLPAARAEAVRQPLLDQQALRSVALSHQVCPYYLSQDLVRWSDLVIADYNYYFDSSALLHGLTQANQWRVALLVDEAHNLIERGRKMYSAELDQRSFNRVRLSAPTELRSALDRLGRQWNAMVKQQSAPYQVWPALPDKFLPALQTASAALGDFFSEQPTRIEQDLQRLYFDLLQFQRLSESFAAHSLYDLSKVDATSVLCLRNVIPAPFLGARFAAAKSATLFSATLSPWHFYCDTLGLPADTAWIDVASPFLASQLQVKLVSAISTRLPQRTKSVAPIIDLIAHQYRQRQGNYLAFFSSFDYLQQITAMFRSVHPDIPIWEQERGMNETARTTFLARFDNAGRGIGFAVLGGAFAEGIDLPGDRLIGAFIATLGLPQMNPVNQQIMQRMEQQFGSGFDYTYLYPGLQKVVQAAGRVIRTPTDQGLVVLIDDRLQQRQVRDLLPRWWRPDLGSEAPR